VVFQPLAPFNCLALFLLLHRHRGSGLSGDKRNNFSRIPYSCSESRRPNR
jgi:hypothetical protein